MLFSRMLYLKSLNKSNRNFLTADYILNDFFYFFEPNPLSCWWVFKYYFIPINNKMGYNFDGHGQEISNLLCRK